MRRRVRWECPNGHPGVLGPSRPRADATVRFCLFCSAGADRLVRRTAPALERERADRERARTARDVKRAESAEERARAYFTVAGIDLRELVREILRTPTGRKFVGPPITIKVRRARSKPRRRLAVAWWTRNTFQITDYPGIDAHDVRESVAHEVAHLMTPRDGHGTRWRTTFRQLCEETFGVRPRLDVRWHGETSKMLREQTIDETGAPS